jgi:hypothetical protein
MKEGERRGKASHPAVIATDVQPMPDSALGEQCPDRRGVIALRRAEQSDCAGPLAERTG